MHVLYKVIVSGLIVAAGGFVLMKQKLYKCCGGCSKAGTESAVSVFPMTVTDIQSRAHSAMEQARKDVAAIVSIPNEQRTFENTIRALDTISSNFSIPYVAISTLNYVHPNEKIRAQAEKTEQLMQDFSIDMFGHNVDLYNAFKAYAENNAVHESLQDDQKYFITESMKDFKRNGLHLPEEQRNRIAQLKKEIGKLELDFSNNINKDASFIVVSRDGLMGLKDDFIDSLQKTDDGNYKLGVDYPTYYEVIEYCAVAETRKKLSKAFGNRAYPANMKILEDIIAKRDQLARELGFESYAHLNLDDEMVKTPDRAETFIRDLIAKSNVKEAEEFKVLKSDLPSSVQLSPNGKLWPWDVPFTQAYYKEKHFKLDERKVAEYFPMQQTIEGLFGIYQDFFNITMKEVPVSGAWSDDVKMVEVYRNSDNQKLGDLLLDLHPRPNKYSHACKIGIVPATKTAQGDINPAVVLVIANFPKSNGGKPALLKHSDVTTFFHEFGHAIHAILGATELASFSGTHVKTDFVEMPSQMLEEWMYDKTMLKQVTKHYQTGEPLPDEMIDTLIALKKFDSGYFVQRQGLFALLSLEYYKSGAVKDTDAIRAELFKQVVSNMEFDPETHMQASFGHLTGYGARYYGYLWSKVFALDLFEFIKPFGLRNHEIGQRYADTILAPGGSVDPNILLRNFLGREPNQEAFLDSMGL